MTASKYAITASFSNCLRANSTTRWKNPPHLSNPLGDDWRLLFPALHLKNCLVYVLRCRLQLTVSRFWVKRHEPGIFFLRAPWRLRCNQVWALGTLSAWLDYCTYGSRQLRISHLCSSYRRVEYQPPSWIWRLHNIGLQRLLCVLFYQLFLLWCVSTSMVHYPRSITGSASSLSILKRSDASRSVNFISRPSLYL